jgi:hypothetical protein
MPGPVPPPLAVLVGLALLLSLNLGTHSLGADERPAAPGALTQAPPAATQQSAKPEDPAATPQEPPPPETPTAVFGPSWRFSSTGRQIPDPTGTNFFRPAISGGTGVVAW